MDYNLETLGDERFQKLCQALLTKTFPNVQCFPVGQPDGGRDATERYQVGFIVFQVKYSRNPASKDERIAVADVIASERSKVERLIGLGATSFYLLTNVSGTSHLNIGSIDRVNAELSSTFGIPCYCWWRDDVERRIEAAGGLIWRYPEIFRGSDFLEILASGRTVALSGEKTQTFRAYVSAQYLRDSEVRFQQVRIQNSLLDLFTDTPIGITREKFPTPEVCIVSETALTQLIAATHNRKYQSFSAERSALLAAEWLLNVSPDAGTQKIVLEGAPGQGKSTVTQYLAQIQRMRTLRKGADAAKVEPSHLNHSVRLPIRVDLRDYAAWLVGKNPFAAEKDVSRPSGGLDGLESFLSYQVHVLSGGRDFGVSDLMGVLGDSHCLLVLDGFDEVADQGTRGRLIDQIRSGSERLGADCKSLQVIVTSRPAAFILSPGFPEREWLHLSLLPMRLEQIGQYTDKWIAARDFPGSEGREFKELLLDRVARSHIRSLAQNPMQLAILLNLITTKGRSLPDKRTALYDSYMDLFFGREAEKDETVRENRDILNQLHQYVAWTLQLDAEKPGGSGSISQSDLQALVSKFLLEKEHDADVLRLFTGAVERVGALVSRVQGMLEFEVQPLREYFSGRYLYETAPYSPPGAEKRGTRPERFSEIARRPYWLNVARFYAGCYNSGELSSLVSGLKQMEEEGSMALASHALQLALLLLNDWVFAQEPRTVREVIAFITSETNLRLLVASRSSWEDERLVLPDKSGRKEFSTRVTAAFLLTNEPEYLNRLGSLLKYNSSLEERWEIWRRIRARGDSAINHAIILGLFLEADGNSRQELLEIYGEIGCEAFISFGRWDILTSDERTSVLRSIVKKAPSYSLISREGSICSKDVDLYRVYRMLDPFIYAIIAFRRSVEEPLERSMEHFGVYLPGQTRDGVSHDSVPRFFDVESAALRASRSSVSDWRTSLAPWSDYIESVRRTWGDGMRLFTLASIAAGIVSKDERALEFGDILNETLPLAERARYARLKSSISWWKAAFDNAHTSSQLSWLLILVFSWAPTSVIIAIAPRLEKTLAECDGEEFRSLLACIRSVISATDTGRQPLSGFSETAVSNLLSQRLKILLVLRLPKALSAKVFIEILDKFDGVDSNLRAFLERRALNEAFKDGRYWNNLISFAHRNGFSSLEPDINLSTSHERHFYRRTDSMSVGIASDVAAHLLSMPITVLEVAEMRLSRRVGASSNPLGQVALDNSWFG